MKRAHKKENVQKRRKKKRNFLDRYHNQDHFETNKKKKNFENRSTNTLKKQKEMT